MCRSSSGNSWELRGETGPSAGRIGEHFIGKVVTESGPKRMHETSLGGGGGERGHPEGHRMGREIIKTSAATAYQLMLYTQRHFSSTMLIRPQPSHPAPPMSEDLEFKR